MSVDSTALERSALERKDRDELLTIAKALGGEPKARVKKADIVDMILELAGVGADHPGADAPVEASAEPKPRATRARSPRSTAAPAKAADDEPPAEWEAAAVDAPSTEAPVEAGEAPEPSERPQGQPDRGGRTSQRTR